MPDNPITNQGFSEAVCIDTGRVYDSCMDRDCIENLRVYFNEAATAAIQNAISCKVKCVEVADVRIDIEPVAFNKGYYSCDLTFFFTLEAEATSNINTCPTSYQGIAAYSKKVILCGSVGEVKTFTSKDESACGKTREATNLPKCTVQVVDPVVLDSKICERSRCEPVCDIPQALLANTIGDVTANGNRALFVTLGLFSIVQLIRDVQLLVPVYDFCMPHKQCNSDPDTPCDVFSKIDFPVDEFFPKSCKERRNCGCEEQ